MMGLVYNSDLVSVRKKNIYSQDFMFSNSLHSFHDCLGSFAQMIHNYMEHLERTKHQHAVAAPEPADTGTNTSVRIR